MASEFARRLVGEQRDRLIASVLTYSERHIYRHLSAEEKKLFRRKVIEAVGSYHDLVLDVLKASIEDGMTTNDEALAMLREIHVAMSRGR